MRTLIVSDLHLGDPRRLVCADGEFCRLLLSEEWSRVVLLGDVFDLWAKTFAQIVVEHATVMAALDSLACPVIYIPGNHDQAFQGIQRLNKFEVHWPSYSWNAGSRVVTAAHGDIYDKTEPRLSKLVAWVSRLVDKVVCWIAGPGVSVTRSVLMSFAAAGLSDGFAREVYRLAVEDLEGDVIIVGHTHTPMAGDIVSGKLVVNSGDFGPQHMTYVLVDEGKIELRTLDSE